LIIDKSLHSVDKVEAKRGGL